MVWGNNTIKRATDNIDRAGDIAGYVIQFHLSGNFFGGIFVDRIGSRDESRASKAGRAREGF